MQASNASSTIIKRHAKLHADETDKDKENQDNDDKKRQIGENSKPKWILIKLISTLF